MSDVAKASHITWDGVESAAISQRAIRISAGYAMRLKLRAIEQPRIVLGKLRQFNPPIPQFKKRL